jgi:hypothetical protein
MGGMILKYHSFLNFNVFTNFCTPQSLNFSKGVSSTDAKISVRTSQETYYVSATKTKWLMLFRERIGAYCEIHVRHMYYTLCGQNAEL